MKTKKKFMKTYAEVMTRSGRGKKLFYQSVMADPISAQILLYSYKMAKDISKENAAWDKEDKEFDYSGAWASYDSDGNERPLFAPDED